MKNKLDELIAIQSRNALKWLLSAACSLLASVSIQAQPNLVLNGGFETGDLTAWTPSSGGDVYADTDPDEEVHSGVYGAYFVSAVGSLTYIFQTLPTIPGRSYLISAWALGTSNRPFPRYNEFHVTWDGINVFDATNNVFVGGGHNWDSDWTNIQVTAVASKQFTVLRFGFQDDGIFGGALGLDEVSVVLVGPTDGRPLVLTGSASEIGPSSATLNGTVWPNGPGTAAWFEYGATTNYGSRTAIISIASSNLAPVQVSGLVGGLSFQTLYHWRLVATNGAGAGFGHDSTLSLVVNGGFETGDFTGWTHRGNTLDDDVDTNPDAVHSGSYGAYFGPVGSFGYISQTLATVPGQSYLVSFWLDSPFGEPPTRFRVSWGGETLHDEVDSGQFDWTSMVFRVTATAWSTELQFGFQNDEDYFGFDDVSVLPITPPEFLPDGLTVTNGNLALTWQSLPGLSYQLQYTTSLPATAWIDLGSSVTATDLTTTVLDPTGSDPRRFYRVIMLP